MSETGKTLRFASSFLGPADKPPHRIQRAALVHLTGQPPFRGETFGELAHAVRKHDVAGFQIPVEDSYFMKCFQCGEQRQRDLPSFLSGKGATLDAPRQGYALNELHHQDQAVLFFHAVVNTAGIRMSYMRRPALLLTT